MKNQTILVVLLMLMLGVFSGCEEKTPEAVLRDFLKVIADKQMTRDYYLEHTTGNLYDKFENATEEEVDEHFQKYDISQTGLKVLRSSCAGDECTLTYIVKYRATHEGPSNTDTESKKIAKLRRVDSEWKIFDLTTLKTFLEVETPINI